VAIEGLSIRSYFDHHVHERFARDLRRHGYDVIIAKDIAYEKASDETHLQWATEHGRVVFTSDFDDFPDMADRWFLEGPDHAGIILMEQPGRIPYGRLLRRLMRLHEILAADDMVNLLEWLDHRWDDNEE
jgi:predicted nuclease of predicted toxin-antitoxin system